MKVEKLKNAELYQISAEMSRIGNRAVHEAQVENHRLGLPNVFSRNGKIFYELPDGEITSISPFKG